MREIAWRCVFWLSLFCITFRADDATERVRKLRRQFAPHEYSSIVECSTPEELSQRFMRYWTLKEAYLKMTGEGISTGAIS